MEKKILFLSQKTAFKEGFVGLGCFDWGGLGLFPTFCIILLRNLEIIFSTKIILMYEFETVIWDILYVMNTFCFHQILTFVIIEHIAFNKKIISR